MKKIKLLSIAVTTGSYNEFVDRIIAFAKEGTGRYTCVANVHMLIEGYQNSEFAQIVKNADLVTPDGTPLCWALRLLYGIKQPRVDGMTLMPDLLLAAETAGVPVFFYGGTDDTIQKTGMYLKSHYPKLQVAGLYSPPFRKLTKAEDDEIVERINSSGAQLVFVVLGCPKQERWMATMKERINALTIGVGGALPVMLGLQQRAPGWMQRGGLEWLFRLMQEPKRLFKRYTVTNSMFIYLLLREFLRTRVARQSA